MIDGEAITNGDGLAVFDLIRHKRHGDDAVLIAFDLIELDGEDLRRAPIEQRKRTLAKLLRRPHAGIVSKRLGSLYPSGRSPHWLKDQESCRARAVKREVKEDWA